MPKPKSAAINAGSQRAKFGDLVQCNNAEGHLLTGAVTKIHRVAGTIYLQLDGTYEVEAFHARLAPIVATIRPGTTVTLQESLNVGGLIFPAGCTLEVLGWREGIAVVQDSRGLFTQVRVATLLAAAFPRLKDLRQVKWERR